MLKTQLRKAETIERNGVLVDDGSRHFAARQQHMRKTIDEFRHTNPKGALRFLCRMVGAPLDDVAVDGPLLHKPFLQRGPMMAGGAGAPRPRRAKRRSPPTSATRSRRSCCRRCASRRTR